TGFGIWSRPLRRKYQLFHPLDTKIGLCQSPPRWLVVLTNPGVLEASGSSGRRHEGSLSGGGIARRHARRRGFDRERRHLAEPRHEDRGLAPERRTERLAGCSRNGQPVVQGATTGRRRGRPGPELGHAPDEVRRGPRWRRRT